MSVFSSLSFGWTYSVVYAASAVWTFLLLKIRNNSSRMLREIVKKKNSMWECWPKKDSQHQPNQQHTNTGSQCLPVPCLTSPYLISTSRSWWPPNTRGRQLFWQSQGLDTSIVGFISWDPSLYFNTWWVPRQQLHQSDTGSTFFYSS